MQFADSMKKWKRTTLPELVAEFADALSLEEHARLRDVVDDTFLQGIEFGCRWAYAIYNDADRNTPLSPPQQEAPAPEREG